MKTNPYESINFDGNELAKKIKALEKRVNQLESKIAYSTKAISIAESESEEDGLNFSFFGKNNANLESNFGQFGLAWLGNFVLFFGISFFVQYLQNSGYGIIASLLGFVAVVGVFLLSRNLQISNPYMAKIFNLNGYLLLFYVVLKLHFFTDNQLINDRIIGLVLLLVVAGILIFLSVRKKNTLLMGMSFIMIAITAVLADSTHFMLVLAVTLSLVSIISLYKFGWIRMVYLAIFVSYFIVLMWIIGNPLMGHKLEMISIHDSGYIYIYLIAALFSLIALMPEKEECYTSVGIVGAIVMNGLGFLFLISLFIISFLQDAYIIPTGLIAFFCIAYAVVLKVYSDWKISAALYALFGFVTLSVTIYGIYDFPQAFFMLAIQSLLVVSLAIWFRSKFIVIMNSLLYFTILMIYLSAYETGNGMNISFSIVALATARILNWKKEHLTIRSEMIRNFYLLIAFVMILFTLYHLISNSYITLSWTAVALAYFLLSIALKNVKYRYMSLGSMIAAAIYLFIVDLARIELIYRVVAMLFLALISIGFSLYYTKKHKKKTE